MLNIIFQASTYAQILNNTFYSAWLGNRDL